MNTTKPLKVLGLIQLVLLCFVFEACTSGKSAYKHGDYYNAVLESVQRLRANPSHKKSKEVLKMSYPAAVSYLETNIQNKMASNDNEKWRVAVQNYSRINTLYEEIMRSPGAMKVIRNPVSKYQELNDAKKKAAEESYEMGLQAMLKNTREDSKQAYFLFKEANNLSPEYRESIEMSNQAKFDATLKVVVEPITINPTNWNFEPIMFGYRGNEFVRFYTPQEVQNENLKRIDQYMSVLVNDYWQGQPNITKRSQEVRDSVKTGEKKVNNVNVPIYSKVKATVTTFEKTVKARGALNLIITDGSSKGEIRNTPITSEQVWSSEWAISTGDARALGQNLRRLTEKKEPFLSNNQLREMVRQDLERKLSGTIAGFYKNY